jgi:hypothetical protein
MRLLDPPPSSGIMIVRTPSATALAPPGSPAGTP